MQSADQAAFDAGCQYVQQQMARGVRDDAILQTMVSQGWDPAMVHAIIKQVRSPQPYMPVGPAIPPAGSYAPPQQHSSLNYYVPPKQQKAYQPSGGGGGGGQMLVGAIICIIGIVITVGSYMAAGNGGSYVVVWGAIVFGAIRFFKGMAEMGR